MEASIDEVRLPCLDKRALEILLCIVKYLRTVSVAIR